MWRCSVADAQCAEWLGFQRYILSVIIILVVVSGARNFSDVWHNVSHAVRLIDRDRTTHIYIYSNVNVGALICNRLFCLFMIVNELVVLTSATFMNPVQS